MLPLNQLSTVLVIGGYLDPDDNTTTDLVDYELGGIEIQDPSQGLRVKTWVVYIDGQDVKITAEDRQPTVQFTRTGVLTEVSLAFDQNMRPTIAFVEDDVATLYWYDTVAQAAVFSTFTGASTPRVCLDDKRESQLGTSDILLAYIKTNNLYFRAQRDRFTVEYLLYTEINAKLVKLGMTDKNRVQFMLQPN